MPKTYSKEEFKKLHDKPTRADEITQLSGFGARNPSDPSLKGSERVYQEPISVKSMAMGPASIMTKPEILQDIPGDFADIGKNILEGFNKRVGRVAENVERRSTDGQMDVIDKASTALDVGGATLSTLSDSIFQAGLGLAKSALTPEQEDRISQGIETAVGKVVDTAPVRAIVSGWNDFEKKNPEAAANIRSGADYAAFLTDILGGKAAPEVIKKSADIIGSTSEPIINTFKRTVKPIVDAKTDVDAKLSAITTGLVKNTGENAVDALKSNYDDIFTSTKPLANQYNFMKERGVDPETKLGYDPSRVLAERKIVIPVNQGKLDTASAVLDLEEEITQKSTTLDAAIEKYPQTISLADLKTKANRAIGANRELQAEIRVKEVQDAVSNMLDTYAEQTGRTQFRLIELQKLKKGQGSASKRYQMADVGRADAHSELASVLREAIEEKIPDVAIKKLNSQIGELIETTNLLVKANKTTVQGGRLGKYFAQMIGAGAGSLGGGWMGAIFGAYAGNKVSEFLQSMKVLGPLKRAALKRADVTPDDQILQDTIKFIEDVENGEKVLPTDETLELMMEMSLINDIPLLPAPVHDALRVQFGSTGVFKMPERTQSGIDAEIRAKELANPNIKPPQGSIPSPLQLAPAGGNPIQVPGETPRNILDEVQKVDSNKIQVESNPAIKSETEKTIDNTTTNSTKDTTFVNPNNGETWDPMKIPYDWASYTTKQKEDYLKALDDWNNRDKISEGKEVSATTKTTDLLEKSIDDLLEKAPEAKKYIDAEIDKIVSEIPGTIAAKAPIKSRERSIEKVKNEDGGDVSKIKDIARNTIITPDAKTNTDTITRMDARKDVVRKKVQIPEENMGYAGVIYNIKTPDGFIAETQVVSPKMTYGKNTPEFSQNILGKELFEKIKAETGLEPGQGHIFYEKWRNMSRKDRHGETGKKLIEESVAYYSKLR